VCASISLNHHEHSDWLLLRRLADEALVTLEYTPGCDRPTGISARLDGAEYGEELLQKLGGVEVGNQAVWRRYVGWRGSLVELARWGHQFEGTPWEEVLPRAGV
jgi:hypothetical protein